MGANAVRPGADPSRPAGVKVWDIPIRAFHWLLVGAVCVSLATGFLAGMSWLGLHLIAGATIAGLIGARLIWGAAGPTHARFAAFAYPPRAVTGHVRDILAGREHRHLGHNPLGAVMVFALLLALAASMATGALALGGMFKQGPLAAFVPFASGSSQLGIHQALAWLLLAMIAGHLAGVAFESWRGRENLVRAMFTGRKRPAPAADAARPLPAHPWLGGILVAALAAASVVGVSALAALPARGVPPPEVEPAYDAACGSCHFAFSPSLNPAWVWNGIMGHLGQHFGLRAPVDAAKAAAIRAYLDANAAERWDTLPAHEFRARDPAAPLRITATPYWRRMHAGIPAAVFASQAVSGKASCNSCHADAATARFAPQAIATPD